MQGMDSRVLMDIVVITGGVIWGRFDYLMRAGLLSSKLRFSF